MCAKSPAPTWCIHVFFKKNPRYVRYFANTTSVECDKLRYLFGDKIAAAGGGGQGGSGGGNGEEEAATASAAEGDIRWKINLK